MKQAQIENGTLFNQIILKEQDGTVWEIKAFRVKPDPKGAIELQHTYRKLRDNGVRRRRRAISRAYIQRMVSLRKKWESENGGPLQEGANER